MAAGGTDAASVEKIRDILFGPQMREHERKVARLEEKLLKETADLKEDVRKSLAASDAFIKKELESLSNRLKAEQDERKEAVKSLAQELKELNQALQRFLLDRLTEVFVKSCPEPEEIEPVGLSHFDRLLAESLYGSRMMAPVPGRAGNRTKVGRHFVQEKSAARERPDVTRDLPARNDAETGPL